MPPPSRGTAAALCRVEVLKCRGNLTERMDASDHAAARIKDKGAEEYHRGAVAGDRVTAV
jgi:hypothetical protein